MVGRPTKQGLEYFYFGTDFFDDDRVKLINGEFEAIGELILIRLLCKIFKDGYFLKWGKDECLLFCKWAGAVFVSNQVNEVILGCLRRSIFDDRVFKMFGILTSADIQSTYLRATAERKEIEIIEDIWLIGLPEDSKKTKYKIIRMDNGTNHSVKLNNLTINSVNTPINSINAPINSINEPINSINEPNNSINAPNNSINRSINSQSKVKESKAKESKEKENTEEVVPTAVGTSSEKQVKQFPHDSIEYKSSKYLAGKILENNPNASKIPRTDEELYKWCVHIDRILRIDKRPADELRNVLVFATKDPFWRTNILSTVKLRERYDTLFMQMTGGRSDGIGYNKGSSSENAPANPSRFANIRPKNAGTGDKL